MNDSASHTKLMTRREAADFLGVRPQTLAAWAMTGKHLRYIKVGRAVRYRQSDLEAWLAKRPLAGCAGDDKCHESA